MKDILTTLEIIENKKVIITASYDFLVWKCKITDERKRYFFDYEIWFEENFETRHEAYIFGIEKFKEQCKFSNCYFDLSKVDQKKFINLSILSGINVSQFDLVNFPILWRIGSEWYCLQRNDEKLSKSYNATNENINNPFTPH